MAIEFGKITFPLHVLGKTGQSGLLPGLALGGGFKQDVGNLGKECRMIGLKCS